MTALTPLSPWSWSDEGTSLRRDSLFLLLALLLHFPLIYLKFETVGQNATSAERLENVDFIEEAAPPTPVVPVPAPERSFLEKVSHFFKPPPAIPAPKIKLPEKPVEVARPEIKAPVVQAPPEVKAKPLVSKEFQEKISAALKPREEDIVTTPVVAPINLAKTSGAKAPAPALKDKGGFHMAQSELPVGISGDLKVAAPGQAGADVIQIPTAKHASAERPAAVVMVDRGSYAGPSSSQGGLSVPSSGIQGAASVPSRLVVPAIPIDARPRAGAAQGTGTGTTKTFQESSAKNIPLPAPASPAAERPAPSLAGAAASAVPAPAVKKRPSRPLFQITGELANRKILVQKLPVYPSWAQAQGITATVALEFTVTPDGNVLPDNVIVKRTSGYDDLDNRAIEALKQWKFADLGPDSNQNQAGVIVFTYALQ